MLTGSQMRSNMKVELNEQECHNIRVGLRSLMKMAETNEESMKVLLVLSDKFVIQQPKVVKSDSKPKKE